MPEIAKRFGVHPSQVFEWKRQIMANDRGAAMPRRRLHGRSGNLRQRETSRQHAAPQGADKGGGAFG